MDAFKKYAHDSIVVLNKENFERVVRQLNKIEALTVIRTAYGASLTEAKEILSYIHLHTRYP